MAKAKISSALRLTVLQADNYICRACGFGGSANYAAFLDCDHVIAESNNGETVANNLQCLCKACNIAKSGNDFSFKVRTESVKESVWAVNQKIVTVAFTIGLKEGTVEKTLKRLK